MKKILQKNYKGNALLEALIGILLVSLVSSGVVLGIKNNMDAQRDSNAQVLVVKKIKEDIQNNGALECYSGNINKNITLKLTNNVNTTVNKTCSLQTLVINQNGVQKSISIPKIEYNIDDSNVISTGKLTIKN